MTRFPRRDLPPLLLLAAVSLVVVSLATAPSLRAQGAQDLSGAWDMEMTANLPQQEVAQQTFGQQALPQQAADCTYVGDCQMDQDGNDLSGTVDLTLVSGPEDCPEEMTTALDGSVAGDAVAGTLNGPQGTAEFVGSEDNSFSGTFEAIQGPLTGSTGEWLAQRQTLAIPALSGVGLTLLVLALLAGGAWMLRRERRPA